MEGKTHIAVGIASSLAILQPKSIPECLCATIGGLIGSIISDIDQPKSRESIDYRDDPYGWQVYTFIVLAIVILLCLDYVDGNGAAEYIINNFGTTIIVGLIAFIGLCIISSQTVHRTFTHSIIAGILFTLCVWVFCQPLSIPFAIGFASHLFLDILNQKKTQLLWPLPWRMSLNLFPFDGKFNDFLCGLGAIASIYLLSYFVIHSFSTSNLFIKLMRVLSGSISILNIDVPFFLVYLITINIIGFVAYMIDYICWTRGLLFYKGSDKDADEMAEFIMTLLLFIDLAGGMIGKLLVVFMNTKGKIYKAEAYANYNLYIIPLCFLISWLALLLTFYIPALSETLYPLSIIEIYGIPVRFIVLGYFVIINIITLFLFPKMKRFHYQITPREKLCMILSFIGGATGGYLSIKFTGKNENASMLVNTLPEMIIMHAIVLTCFFYII